MAGRSTRSLGSIKSVDHPISCLVTRPAEKSQRAFAVAASQFVQAIERVSAEISDEGLIVRGLTELDVELGVWEVKQNFANVYVGKPEVAYDLGPPLLEPYYRAIIYVPEECVAPVVGDMSTRRAALQAVRDDPNGKRVVALVPVSECFGYSTVLRALTRGRGKFFVEFSHYGRAGGNDAA